MRAHLAGAINFAGNFVKRNALAVDSDGQDRTFIEFRVRDRPLEFRHSFFLVFAPTGQQNVLSQGSSRIG
jgi:hypothetical protein